MGIRKSVALSPPYVEAQSMIGLCDKKRDVYSWHNANKLLLYWHGNLKTHLSTSRHALWICLWRLWCTCVTLFIHHQVNMFLSHCAWSASGSMGDTFRFDWRWRLRRRQNWSRHWTDDWGGRFYWWSSVTGASQWNVPYQWASIPIPQRWCGDCLDWHDSE